jgi:hypothetical protein
VSRAGALRPTTRAPLLVCHPTDTAWFGERRLLPGLARATRPGEQTLQIINAPGLSPGLALLDAPDIDSVVASNRRIARELLAAGDLWLFVTTAARYADAVPWQVLRDARERGTAVAVVLDRVPAEARDEIAAHLARMLAAEGLFDAPLFVVPESTLDGYGMISELDIAPIKRWLDGIARDGGLRGVTARRTLLGAVAAVPAHVEVLARAAEDQVRAASHLGGIVNEAFAAALSDVEVGLRSGSMLRGRVYTRFQELWASGELRLALRTRTERQFRELASGAGRGSREPAGGSDQGSPEPASGAGRGSREPAGGSDQGSPEPATGAGQRFSFAVAGALAELICDADMVAAQRCLQAWRATPEGRALLAMNSDLGRPWPGFADAAHDLVHEWQRWIRFTARAEAARVRTKTRSRRTAATVLLVSVASVAPTRGETAPAGISARMLRILVRDRVVGGLAERARVELVARVGQLYAAEVDRHVAAVAAAGVDAQAATTLRDAAARLSAAQSSVTIGLGEAA